MSEPDKPETPPAVAPPPYGAYSPYGGYPGSYPPPPPMPYAGYPAPPTGPRNGLGVAALVLAIVGLVLCWTVAGGIILGLCAVIIGFVARGRVTHGEATNGGVAIAGIVLGILAIIVSLVFIPIYIAAFQEVGGGDYMDCLSKAGGDQHAVQQCADQFRNRVEDQFSITLTPTR
jgi:hypothetical protein